MDYGVRYKTLEEVVTILERYLGIKMERNEDGETGISYDWFTEPDARGFSWHEITVEETRVFDHEENRIVLRHRDWRPYTFVIGVSDELVEYDARIQHLIKQRLLIAEEIPFREVF